MSLRDQVQAMRVVMTSAKACHHGYQLPGVIAVLYSYIAELESKLAAPVEKLAPSKAPAKKAPAKKAPAKKAPAKKVWKKKA